MIANDTTLHKRPKKHRKSLYDKVYREKEIEVSDDLQTFTLKNYTSLLSSSYFYENGCEKKTSWRFRFVCNNKW